MSNLGEAQTRRDLIDPALKKAGWDVNNPDLIRRANVVKGCEWVRCAICRQRCWKEPLILQAIVNLKR